MEAAEAAMLACHDLLLSHMLRRLEHCLDIVQSNRQVEAGAAGAVMAMERPRRGRDRKLPFFYDPRSKTFAHR